MGLKDKDVGTATRWAERARRGRGTYTKTLEGKRKSLEEGKDDSQDFFFPESWKDPQRCWVLESFVKLRVSPQSMHVNEGWDDKNMYICTPAMRNRSAKPPQACTTAPEKK